ncbi:MAG TPA: hypothetical protein VFX97_04710 [Pyrinomonadaceae bacterium]|nr:hypothetical protein [Pyrinomonadaceae bacterium]
MITRFALTLTLLLMACAIASAQPQAKGTYKFTLGDNNAKHVEFDAQGREGGGASGTLFVSDEATIVYHDVDGDGSPEEKYTGYSMLVAFDDMTVDKNQAVMQGVVRDSTIPFLVGQRVLLTVEDNGNNEREPDRLTWGVYKPIERNWIPSDAEWKDDPGVGLRWWATDAERKDDVGYEMPREDKISIKSFTLSAYLFVDTNDGVGDIIVRP